MENAITYKDLYLSFGEVISMDRLEIAQSPNRHGRLSLSAVLNGEGGGEVFDELPEEVSVLYREDGEEKVLFKGMVTDSSMKRVGNHRKLELKAYDATYLLDTRRKTRSFQDTSRTNHSVITEVMKEYPECICMKNLPEKPIGRIWFQYEETDWEFLRRFLSSYSDSLYADATCHTARFQAGLSPEDIEVDWDDCPYGMGKNLERYDFLSQNGFEGLGIDQFIEYSVDSYGLYTLGSRLLYKGRRWYVGELVRKLTDGLLTTTYRLQQREGLLKPQEYNQRITGVSLDGKTVKVQDDTVRVSMNGDMTTEQGTYWFPFSTFASSADGSGWYSMPKEGDSIRVYFPTCDEKEGYVITKHDSHMPAAKKAAGGGTPHITSEKTKVAAAVPAKAISAAVMPTKEISAVAISVDRGSRNRISAINSNQVFTLEKPIGNQVFTLEKPISNQMFQLEKPIGSQLFMSEKAPDSQMPMLGMAIDRGSVARRVPGGVSETGGGGGGSDAGGSFGGGGSDAGGSFGGGGSDAGGSSGGGGGSDVGESFGGGGGSDAGGGSGGGGGGTAGNTDAAGEKAEEKKADPEKEDPMDDPSKRNIFTQDGCVVQLVPAGVILTAGKSSLMLKKNGEIVMDAPVGISVYAGEKLTMTAQKITVKAGSLIELKDESGADVAIRKQHIKLHGQEIFEN